MTQELYSRQVVIPSIGSKVQNTLFKSNVLVIGAGGLGSPLLTYLTAAGVGNITIVDHDVLSVSNLNRQTLYSAENIGESKADLAKVRLESLGHGTSITSHSKRVGVENFLELASSKDLIIDCSDNFETKFMIHDLSFQNKKNLLQGNVYQFDGDIKMFPYDRSYSIEQPCLRCLWESTPDGRGNGGIIGATSGVVGSLMATEAIKFLGNISTQLSFGESLTVELLTNSFDIYKYKKNSDCLLCGDL